MKILNKFRLRKVSFMLSLIMIAGSLSGPVFASHTSASNEMTEAVESSEMPDDIDATEKAEVTDDNTDPDGEIASEKETRGNSEESGKETVEDTRSKDESEETLDQSSLEDKADYENSLDDILSESSDSLETSGRGNGNN